MARQTILTQFPGGGVMPYWTDKNTVDIADRVIVETNKGKFVTATVIQTEEIPERIKKKAKRWIVQRLDLEKYESRRNR